MVTENNQMIPKAHCNNDALRLTLPLLLIRSDDILPKPLQKMPLYLARG